LGDVEVRGDRDLLTQLFTNLVENAIRHCPLGSRIAIAAELQTTGPVVSISDNGPGIPFEERQNVFRRLYRLEKSRTTPGSGLGLALVAAIAELHDAKIELRDNAPGLLIELRFPAHAQSTQSMAAE
jgi:signal transduction histidine kinase